MASFSQVLLISPRLNLEVAGRVPARIQENLGLGYLASFLESKGIGVDLVDLNCSSTEEEQLTARAMDFKTGIIGISIHSPSDLKSALALTSNFRRMGTRSHITFGGHYATQKDLEILSAPEIPDSVVRGEGELTLYELYLRLNESVHLNNLAGISLNLNGKATRNEDREVITDLDTLPFPKRYNLEQVLRSKQKLAHMLTSRGCPGRCSFCVAPLNRGWRTRSVNNVVEEIRTLRSMGIKNIVFVDDNYAGWGPKGRERASEIADELMRLHLGINYQFSLRVDCLDDDLIEKFVNSGVCRMRVGIESFNQRQLDWYNKRTTSQQVVNAMEKIIASGIEPHFSFITFDPYTSLVELERTIYFMRKFARHIHFRYVTAPLKPLEGSIAWTQLKNEGLLVEKGHKDSFRFVNQDAGFVWEDVQFFRKYMADVEQRYNQFTQNLALFEEDGSNADFLRLREVKKEMGFRTTTLWLDILQYSIYRAKEMAVYQPVTAPEEIRHKHYQLLKWVSKT